MEKKNLEEKLKSEGKNFSPNVLSKVYEKLGLELSSSTENKKVETKLMEEGEKLVPNNYEAVSKNITPKKQSVGFLAFIKNPITISVSASLLVAVVATSIVVPLLLNRNVNSVNETDAIAVDNTVTLDLTSASQNYNAKVKYVINTEGNVESNKIITLDDNSAYLIDKFNTAPTTRLNENIKNEKHTVFTTKYLTTALNYGYLEKLDITKSNKLVFKITSPSSNNISSLKNELEDNILSFMEENKVIIDYEIEEVKVDIYSEFEEQDYEKASLILDMYNLATRLFVGEDKTLTEAYFSSDLNDWVARFKDSDKEEIQSYVDMLSEFNEYIVGNEQRNRMIDDFYKYSEKFLNEIKVFNSYIPTINERLTSVINSLKENGSDELKGYLNENNYPQLSRYLNEKYQSQNRRMDRKEPVGEIRVWDFFLDGYFMFNNHQPMRPGQVNPGDFLQYLPKTYGEGTTYSTNEETLFNLYVDLASLINFRDTAVLFVDDNFFEIVLDIIEEQLFMMDWDDDEYCHNHDEPDGWNEDFDNWWKNNNHGDHHHH